MDHKGLIHLLKQKNLSGQQACWMEKISEFNFEVIYIPGSENILSDALSWLYSCNEPGTVHAHSEYTYHDVLDNDGLEMHSISMPLLVGLEATSVSLGDAAEMGGEGGIGNLEGMSVPGPSAPQTRHGVVEPAETGHPETFHEFAACVSCSFMLYGPQREEVKSALIPSTTLPVDPLLNERLTICNLACKKRAQDAPDMEQTLDAELAKHADAAQHAQASASCHSRGVISWRMRVN